jgi:hypothetical protein
MKPHQEKIPMRISVTTVPSTAPFGGALRAGRQWPWDRATQVEVVDGDDPTIEEDLIVDGKRRGKRQVPDPTRVSRGVYEALKADSRLIVVEL